MARKTKKKVKKKINHSRNKENYNQIKHLEVLLAFTVRVIDGRSEQLDIIFMGQANKIKDQIEKLKE